MIPPTPPTPQQRAIQEVRARYERGELSFEAFHHALDALLLAQDGEECAVILAALPAPSLAPLAALDAPRPDAPQPGAPDHLGHKSIVAFLGQTKKMRRAWQLAPDTAATACMGEVQLDLSRAELPPVGVKTRLRVTAILGGVTLYVPRAARVTVRAKVMLGEGNLLGESTSGIIAFGHEEHAPAAIAAPAEIEIEALVFMGNVKVVLTDGPVVSIGELLRETFRLAIEGVRRGLQQSQLRASQRQPLGAPSRTDER
jgi:hypothetical protein